MLMTGLNTSLCEEEITYRKVENFKIRQSYLGRFRHSLVVNLVFNYRSWGYLW